MKIYQLTLLTFSMLVLAACSKNPVAPDDHELTVKLSMSTEHVSTLTFIDFEVELVDHEGLQTSAVADMQVEYRLVGETEWDVAVLEQHEDHYKTEIMFMSSGEYDVRITGDEHGDSHMDEMYVMAQALEVERIHQEIGGFIVEMETFPGHVREGEEVEVNFYIMEKDGDHDGNMMPGLVTDIRGTGADGVVENHTGDEHEGPGIYTARHTFTEAGNASVEIHFEDSSGLELHAEFQIPVDHGH